MKPIGIGNLKKAQPKTPIALSRHETETVTPDLLAKSSSSPTENRSSEHLPIEHVITAQNDTFDNTEQEGQLSIDVYQTDTELILIAPVAGTPPDQLNVSITDDVITIKGRRELPFENPSDESIYLQECFWGNFSRSLILPVAVDLNHVEARFKNNVLTVRIPKTERIRTRVIRIEE